MKTSADSRLDSKEALLLADALSTDLALRAVELAFLLRLTDAAQTTRAAILQKVQTGDETVAAALARMQNPVFERRARALEGTVPEDAGFGRFRGRP